MIGVALGFARTRGKMLDHEASSMEAPVRSRGRGFIGRFILS